MMRGDRWRRIHLSSGGSIALRARVDIARLSDDDLRFVAGILDTIGSYEQAQAQNERAQNERSRAVVKRSDALALSRWLDDGGAP